MATLRDLILAKHLSENADQPNGWFLPCVGPGTSAVISAGGETAPRVDPVWGAWAGAGKKDVGAGKGETFVTDGAPYQHPYFHIIFDTADSTGSSIVGDLTVTEPAPSPGFWDGYINAAKTTVSFPETPTEWLPVSPVVVLVGPLNNAGQTATIVVTYSDADGIAASATVTYTVNDDGTVSSVTSGTIPTNYAISVECTAADSNVGPIRVIFTVELDDDSSNQGNLNAGAYRTRPGATSYSNMVNRVDMSGFFIAPLNDSSVITTRSISAYSGTDDMDLMVDFIPGPCCNDRENWAPYFNGTGTSTRGWYDAGTTSVVYSDQWIAVDEQYAFGREQSARPPARADRLYRWTEFIPADVKWAMEVYFNPDPDIAYEISGANYYWIGGYRNSGLTARHCWWMIEVDEVDSEPVYALRRREFANVSPGTAPRVEFPRLCLGRWNQLVVQWEPNSTTPGSANGKFRYWWNGKPWFLGTQVPHGGEEPPSIPYHSIMWGYDPLNYWSSGSSPAYPFWGAIAYPSWHMDSDIDDAYVRETWLAVCRGCKDEASILEVPC